MGLLAFAFELATGFAAAAAPFLLCVPFSKSHSADGQPRATPIPRGALRKSALTRRSHKPASSCTMAESIPKAKSAYAFFQAAMNKQMVGVPLG